MGGPVRQDASVLKCCVPAAAVAEPWDAGHAVSWTAGSWGWPTAPVVSHCHGLWPLRCCPQAGVTDPGAVCLSVTVGDLLPSLTDALPAAQLLCKQSWDWGLFLFIPSHKIFKFEKNPTPTPGKPPITKDISREGYFPFFPAGQGCCPFVPWCSAFHFVVCCSWVRPGHRSLSKLGAS